MNRYTNNILPPFDFSAAESLDLTARLDASISRARELSSEYAQFSSVPPVPSVGASTEELDILASDLGGNLPDELREFLSRCRYLIIDDGINIGGFDHDGVYAAEPVWMSDEHMADRHFLVFGAYWHHADGDQLLIDVNDPSLPVIAYLHEHGPAFEYYAPSFSLALWRLVNEVEA